MATGTRYTYTDTVTPKPAISDAIFNIDYQEAPLLRMAGFSASNLSKIKVIGWPATKLQWLHDVNSPTFTTMNDSGGIDGSVTTVTVTEGTYFRQGDVVGIYANAAGTGDPAEKVLVTSVSGNDLTIVRGVGSTSGAVHADGVGMRILSRMMPEGSDPVTGHTTIPTLDYNYVQILSEAVKVTKTEQAIMRYGIEDQMAFQVAKLFDDDGGAGKLARMLENTFYYGERVIRDGTAGEQTYGSMGGFKTFVTLAGVGSSQYIDLNGAAFNRSHLHTVLRSIRQNNGRVDSLVMGGWAYEKITDMYSGTIETTRDERIGGSEIQQIVTPHGRVKLVYDWMCPEHEMFFVDFNKLGWVPLRPWEATQIRDQGDYFITDVVGEFTFFLRNPKSFGIITDFSTTS